MEVSIPSSDYIVCMCEGGAEITVMDILLDHDLLIFSREQMLGEQLLPRMSVSDFQNRYLRLEYDKNLCILRVIDSRRDQFKLAKPYQRQVDKIINVISAPEIEMLVIVSLDKYDDFQKSGVKKPSDYCRNVLKIKNVKSPTFIRQHFEESEFLVASIREYHRIHKQKPQEASLYDLLK